MSTIEEIVRCLQQAELIPTKRELLAALSGNPEYLTSEGGGPGRLRLNEPPPGPMVRAERFDAEVCARGRVEVKLRDQETLNNALAKTNRMLSALCVNHGVPVANVDGIEAWWDTQLTMAFRIGVDACKKAVLAKQSPAHGIFPDIVNLQVPDPATPVTPPRHFVHGAPAVIPRTSFTPAPPAAQGPGFAPVT